jgi:hypothetical protein
MTANLQFWPAVKVLLVIFHVLIFDSGISGAATVTIKPATEAISMLTGPPAGARMWETVPGVIRNDGIDAFRLEVNANGPVSGISLEVWPPILSQSGQTNVALRDDGLQGDRVAGDRIFASEPLRFDTNQPWLHAPYYAYDTNSPAGVSIKDVGRVTISEINGGQSAFLHEPQIGLLSFDVPLVDVVTLSSNVAVSLHLINVRGTNLSVQKSIRGYSLGTADLAHLIYSTLPDAFDFLIHFSNYRIERLPPTSAANFTIGVQRPVQVNFSGTGQAMFNNTATYGSSGRLLAVVALDCYERGVWSYNCTHEILHQWSSYIGALPISDGQHYVARSSVASLLGGQLWASSSNGAWTLVCEEGRNGATHLDLLDKYMMGLISADQVPTLRTYPRSDPLPLFICNEQITEVESVVTIQDIIARYGVRTPGPEAAQRDFSLGFVVETTGRFLNPVEMTFYDILAGHYTSAVPPGHSDPYIGFNWAPITRYFGEGTTWRSEVLAHIRPQIVSLERVPNTSSVRLIGHGLAGRPYQIQSSTDFSAWSTRATRVAGPDGEFIFDDNLEPTSPRFYRITGN